MGTYRRENKNQSYQEMAKLHRSFHVVVPSIPGYFLSTLPNRDGWNLLDIAHAYNGLMVEVLGYKRYVGQGGDLVCITCCIEKT